MFRGLFEGWHLIVVLLVVLLVFGANRLPGAARNLAQSLRIFKRELDGGNDDATGPSANPPATPGTSALPPTTGQPGTSTPPAGPDTPPPAAGGTAARA